MQLPAWSLVIIGVLNAGIGLLWLFALSIPWLGKPANESPPNDGYVEIQLPKAFFEGNPKSITLNWERLLALVDAHSAR
jgi:hypothetical protein